MGTVGKIQGHLLASTAFATCETSAINNAKVATIQNSQSFSLIEGITVHVWFKYGVIRSSGGSITLNINNTGDKTIYFRGSNTGPLDTGTYFWSAGSIRSFSFYNNRWYMNEGGAQSDWNENSEGAPGQILNKPDLSTFIKTNDNANLTSLTASGYVEGNNVWANGQFYVNKPEIDVSKNNNGLSTDVNTGLYLRGINDANIGKIGQGYRTNGDGYVELYAYNKNDTQNKLLLSVDNSGNNTVSVTSGEAWRNALNIIKPSVTKSTSISAVSVSNNAAKTLTSFTLQPGKYIIMCWARFNPHADTGYRYIFLTDSSTGTSPVELMAEKQIGANGSNISLSMDINLELTVSSATTYYFRAWHNAGASIDVTPRYHIVQID